MSPDRIEILQPSPPLHDMAYLDAYMIANSGAISPVIDLLSIFPSPLIYIY